MNQIAALLRSKGYPVTLLTEEKISIPGYNIEIYRCERNFYRIYDCFATDADGVILFVTTFIPLTDLQRKVISQFPWFNFNIFMRTRPFLLINIENVSYDIEYSPENKIYTFSRHHYDRLNIDDRSFTFEQGYQFLSDLTYQLIKKYPNWLEKANHNKELRDWLLAQEYLDQDYPYLVGDNILISNQYIDLIIDR